MKTLGLVVPCYDEQEVLELFYTETIKVISSLAETIPAKSFSWTTAARTVRCRSCRTSP